ncbi:YheU family protein [Mariniblastus fucicola]|uniref:YheU family protein n=1 Tax=Mariniblastus fucicola TaxID=980251 RepID=A0A5B9P4B3_9BACT|nr:YheU family protein [Mariniblastus fucicola]QEG21074.1 hypothetical protein MFFC18_09260 [Mariniblastus fucicola]
MKIPHTQVSAEALRAIVEEFVTRDGTDYTHVAQRISDVYGLLKTGDAELHFDAETNSCNIVMRST